MTFSEDSASRSTYERLLAAGWGAHDILAEQLVTREQRVLRPDFMLLHHLNPLAIIEVTRGASTRETAADQARHQMEMLGFPFAFVCDGMRFFEVDRMGGTPRTLEALPGPDALWRWTDPSEIPNDPRTFPAYDLGRSPRLHQATAVSTVVEAIMSGRKRVMVHMAQGTGTSYVQFQIAWKLIRSGFRRRMLLLSPTIASLHQTALVFAPFREQVRTFSGASDPAAVAPPFTEQVQLWSTSFLLESRPSPRYLQIPPGAVDLILISALPASRSERIQDLLDHFADASVVAFTNDPLTRGVWQQEMGAPVFEHTVEQALEIAEMSPPEGFQAVRLEAIADLSSGIPLPPPGEQDPDNGARVVSVRNLSAGGDLDLAGSRRVPLPASAESEQSRWRLRQGDIVLSTMPPFRTAVVSATPPEVLLFSSSLIRLRTHEPHRAKAIVDFLRSDAGMAALRQLSTGAVVPRLSVRALGQMLVFLPTTRPEPRGVDVPAEDAPGIDTQPTPLSAAASAVRLLEDEILPALRASDAEPGEEAGYATEMASVAVRLRRIADTLAPPTLAEVVIGSFPMPIALSYRRFHESRFNPFEQVLRLRDVAESASFFVYNVLLADLLRNLDATRYGIDDKGARRAYKGYSMAARLDFIKAIITQAAVNGGADLFIPELARATRFVDLARSVQDDLRNRISHTAASTESQQRALTQEFQPKVEEMLGELQFLTRYPMVRVTGFFYSGGRLYRRLEIYSGVAPRIEELALAETGVPTPAEREHLVLLNEDDQILDLYPLYQMLSSEETRHEMHLCVFKQRKKELRRMEGESVPGAFPLDLQGFEAFEALERKLAAD